MKTKQWLLLTLAGLGLTAGSSRAAAAPEPKAADKPEPAVATQLNVNVRGRAAINSEVVTHLKKGQVVTVLEEVTLKKPKTDEPSRWYRIALPTNAVVWVNSTYIDQTNKTVKPKRLNLRSGPGENFSILGRLEKGATVNVLGDKDGWLKLEPPANACGFVAAHLLKKQAGEVAVPPIIAVVPPAATNVEAAVPPPVATELKTNPTVAVAEPMTITNAGPAAAMTNTGVIVITAAPDATNLVSVPDAGATNAPEPLLPRVVTREGLLKTALNIQAPSYFELRGMDGGRLINYVWASSTNIHLRDYKNKKVLITGEETLDERWQHTPVLNVDKIDLAP